MSGRLPETLEQFFDRVAGDIAQCCLHDVGFEAPVSVYVVEPCGRIVSGAFMPHRHSGELLLYLFKPPTDDDGISDYKCIYPLEAQVIDRKARSFKIILHCD